ncbi:MAG TPA: TonB-dependent receptor plug domain-containing protein, partial [Gemmatimonadaceae bacterium]|nr:TonB-dependent receptor plug domain-containing protein [Gemmatimonadaceae bacterium]
MLCTVLLLALAPVALRGQAPPGVRIAGTVTDGQRGDPIAAAMVRIVELHRAEQTHDDGSFELHAVPVGRYTLSISRIGYRPVTRPLVVPATGVEPLRIAMTPAVVQLQTQVVTGSVTARTGEEVLSARSVLSDAALDRRLAATVASTLESQPGVSVSSVGGATARPVIRGLGGDRILVLEDGQRPGDLSSTSGDHAVSVEALSAKSMEVVRGPMSLLYGSSALGGVVNVVREEVPRSLPEHVHGTFTSQLQSALRGGTLGGEVQAPLGQRFAGRAELTARGAGETRTPIGRLPNTEARTFGGALGVAAFLGENHAGLSYRFYDNLYGIPGGFAGA